MYASRPGVFVPVLNNCVTPVRDRLEPCTAITVAINAQLYKSQDWANMKQTNHVFKKKKLQQSSFSIYFINTVS
jgi:hypothetical protein